MDRSMMRTGLIGWVALIVIGMLFHELYKSTGITVLGLISPVNESKWEHWKMALWPMILISLFEYIYLRGTVNNYVFSLALGIVVFECVTFGGIELYEILFGTSHLGVHVTTFILGATAGQGIRYWLMLKLPSSRALFVIGLLLIGVQVVVFGLYTYNPPKMDYFRDSLTGSYGIKDIK